MHAIAHRGYSAAYPENSRQAFEQAIAVGAWAIETDLRLSADGVIVCCHDPGLNRIANLPMAIAEHRWDWLREVDLPGGHHLLSLPEVLGIANGRVRVLLDVKVQTPAMIAAVREALQGITPAPVLIYGARSLEHLDGLLAQAPELTVLAMPAALEDIPAFLQRGVRHLRLWEEDVSPERVRDLQAAGCAAWVTAGRRLEGESAGTITAPRLDALQVLGVEAVLINDPTLVLHPDGDGPPAAQGYTADGKRRPRSSQGKP